MSSLSNRKLFERPNSYVIGWPGSSPVNIEHGFQNLLVPGRDQVAKPGRGSVFRYPSAVDASGRPIPGTIVVEDVFNRNAITNTLVKEFDARGFCEGFLGNALGTAMEKRGLFIVSDASEVPEAMKKSMTTFWRSERRWAETRLYDELARREKEKSSGAPPRALTEGEYNEIQRARDVMAAQPPDGVQLTFSDDDLRGSLGVSSRPGPASPLPVEEEHYDPRRAAAEEVAQKADKLAVAQEVLKRAGEVGYAPTKSDLMGLLGGDELILLEIVTKIEAKAGQKKTAEPETTEAVPA